LDYDSKPRGKAQETKIENKRKTKERKQARNDLGPVSGNSLSKRGNSRIGERFLLGFDEYLSYRDQKKEIMKISVPTKRETKIKRNRISKERR